MSKIKMSKIKITDYLSCENYRKLIKSANEAGVENSWDTCTADQFGDVAFKQYGLIKGSILYTEEKIYFNSLIKEGWYTTKAPKGYNYGYNANHPYPKKGKLLTVWDYYRGWLEDGPWRKQIEFDLELLNLEIKKLFALKTVDKMSREIAELKDKVKMYRVATDLYKD